MNKIWHLGDKTVRIISENYYYEIIGGFGWRSKTNNFLNQFRKKIGLHSKIMF